MSRSSSPSPSNLKFKRRSPKKEENQENRQNPSNEKKYERKREHEKSVRTNQGLNNEQVSNKTNFNFNKKSSSKQMSDENVSFDLKGNLAEFLTKHLDTEQVALLDVASHELEFRMGSYRVKRTDQTPSFDAFISRLKFNRIIQYYNQTIDPSKLQEEISLDIVYDENFRVTVKGETLNNSKSEIEFFCKTNRLKENTSSFMEKIQVQKSDNPDWSFRLTSSNENKLTNQTQILKIRKAVEDKSISKFYRYKYRFSFNLSDKVRLDLTLVKETPPGGTAGTLVSSRTLAQKEKYQVEMEYTGTDFSVETLVSELEPHLSELICLFSGTKGTKIPISVSHTNLILQRYIQLSVGVNLSPDEINYGTEKQKFLAMEVEALTRQNFNKILNDYVVTVKADGEHYLLYSHPDLGLYLINNRLEVSIVKLNETNNLEGRQKFKDIGQCIFDGELVEYEGKFRFLIFDCFFYLNQDVRDLPLYVKNKDGLIVNDKCRIFYTRAFMKLITNDLLSDELAIDEKIHYPLNRIGRFFKKILKGDQEISILEEDNNPYNIDGLVFTNVAEPYPKIEYRAGRFIKQGSMDDPDNIPPILKWKPPEFLSVDFTVSFSSNDPVKKINGQDYLVMTLESSYGNKVLPFEPSCYRVKDYNKAYIPITKGQPQIIAIDGYRVDEEGLGHVIRNKDVLEFVWIPDKLLGNDYWGRWAPIKYREDKTQGGYPNNYLKVSDKTWMAIHEKQILPENLMDPYGQSLESPQLDMGYYQNIHRDDLLDLRNMHNSIKSILFFLAIKQSGNRADRIMDLASGRGGDFAKLTGIKYVFGIEFDEGNLKAGDSSAYGRYRWMMESSLKNNRKAPFTLDLVQGDMRELLTSGNVSNERVFNYIIADRLSRNPESFGVVSCQFAIHYACGDERHLDNFFKNVSENLAPNGYFIATTFDGEKILNSLKNSDITDEEGQPTLVGKDNDGRIIWSISSPVKYSKLEDVGQRILVFNKTIKEEAEVEYLVNFNYLTQVARKYNLYPGKFSYGKHSLPMDAGYGIGGFAEIYGDDYLKLIGDSVYAKGSPRYKEIERSQQRIINDVKRYSKFSSYLIFRKQAS